MSIRALGMTAATLAVLTGAAIASPAFAALTAHHLRWALGARREPPPAAPARELLRASRREFRAASPRLRRWLSPLNPLAWTRVR